MINRAANICLVAFGTLAFVTAACETAQRDAAHNARTTYAEPRFPSYLKPPTTIDEVLPHVRLLARNKIGFQGNGLGIAQPGESVAFVLAPTAEDLIVQAVKRAMEERGVKVNLVPEYEMAGVSREDAAAFEKARRTFTSEQGDMEATLWVEANSHDPAAVKSWLKSRRPDLYGDPDHLLTEDWRPEIPGINAPGDYATDYAPNPWKTVKGVIDRVLAGNYAHFCPLTSGRSPSGPKATEY